MESSTWCRCGWARATRQHWVEEGYPAVAQRVVVGEGSKVHRAVEGAYIRIAGEPRALRAGDEVLGERLADLGGRDSARPGGEVAGRNRSGLYIRSFGGAARRLGCVCAGCCGWCGGGRGRSLRGQCGGDEHEGCAEERDGPEVHGFILERWLRRCRSTSLIGEGENGQLQGHRGCHMLFDQSVCIRLTDHPVNALHNDAESHLTNV